MKLICCWLKKWQMGFAVFFMICGIFASFTPAVLEGVSLIAENGRKRGEYEMANTPNMDSITLKKSSNEFTELYGQYPKKPEDYYWAQRWFNMRKRAALNWQRKFAKSESIRWGIEPIEELSQSMKELDYVYARFEDQANIRMTTEQFRLGNEEFTKANGLDKMDPIILDTRKFWQLFGLGYLLACLSSGIYFVPKLLVNKRKIWANVINGKLPLAMAVFPIMFRALPWGDPKQELKQALQFLIGLIGIFLVNSPVALGQGKTKTEKSSGKNRTVLLKKAQADAVSGGSDDVDERFLITQFKNTDPPTCEFTDLVPKDPSSLTTSSKIKWSGSTMLLNHYVGFDGKEFYDRPVQQTVVTAALKWGGYWSYFNSTAYNQSVSGPNYGNENALTFGYSRKVGEKFSVDVGVTYDVVSPLKKAPAGDVIQFYGTLSRAASKLGAHSFSPFVTVRKFVPVKGKSPEGGTFVEAGVNHSWQKNQWGVDSYFTLLRDDGAFGFLPSMVLRSGATLKHQVRSTRYYILFPIIRFSARMSSNPRDRTKAFVIGTGFSW